MKIFNPYTKQVIEEVKPDDTNSIQRKFDQLKAAENQWKNYDIKKRINVIRSFSEKLIEHKEELAKTLTSEMGKPISEATGEIEGAVKKIQFFLENSIKILETKTQYEDDTMKEVLSFEPLGTICNISAWNYPYLVGVNIFIPALITGNCVLYKPSEYATLTGIKITELLTSSGLPKDVFQIAIGDSKVGDMLLDYDFDGFYFTGSYKTGRHIAERTAGKLASSILELGGKDPCYVTDELDSISATAENVMWGSFYNNGQSCCAIERIYVHESIYEEFKEKIARHCNQLILGDPADKKTQIGALTRLDHIAYLQNQVDEAISKGAQLLCGGRSQGSSYLPTIIADANHTMSLMCEETFGPIVGLEKVANDDEAVKKMNDSRYGLTASVFSNNHDRAHEIMKKVNAGTVYLNCSDRVSSYLPWSGRGHSGLNSSLSYLGLYAFCAPKGYHLKK